MHLIVILYHKTNASYHVSYTGMSGIGISAVDSSADLLCGRPYGGVAFLWQKSLGYNIHYLYSGYNWCLAISLSDNKGNTLTVVNVYYPCCLLYTI